MVQTVQKTVKVPQVQIVDEVVDVPVVKHRQVPMVQKVQRTVEVPRIQVVEKVVDVPVVKQVEVPHIQTIEKVVEIPQIQTVEKIVEVPQVTQGAGGQRRVTLQGETVRQVAPAQVQEVVER